MVKKTSLPLIRDPTLHLPELKTFWGWSFSAAVGRGISEYVCGADISRQLGLGLSKLEKPQTWVCVVVVPSWPDHHAGHGGLRGTWHEPGRTDANSGICS